MLEYTSAKKATPYYLATKPVPMHWTHECIFDFLDHWLHLAEHGALPSQFCCVDNIENIVEDAIEAGPASYREKFEAVRKWIYLHPQITDAIWKTELGDPEYHTEAIPAIVLDSLTKKPVYDIFEW